jgi:hypothetical protein
MVLCNIYGMRKKRRQTMIVSGGRLSNGKVVPGEGGKIFKSPGTGEKICNTSIYQMINYRMITGTLLFHALRQEHFCLENSLF